MGFKGTQDVDEGLDGRSCVCWLNRVLSWWGFLYVFSAQRRRLTRIQV